MRPTLGLAIAVLLGVLAGCSQSDREKERADAKALGKNVERALEPVPADARSAGNQAAVKLDRAAMIARVTAKLANDVGLGTVASVDVDASGHVVTLRGTVTGDAERQRAERAVSQIGGVSKVVDELKVQP
jgi:osmotically-inducible protein OsmY